MKKPILFSLSLFILIAILSGFAASKSIQGVKIKMHVKDLPKHGLNLIDPADPLFDGMLRGELNDKGNDVIEALKPYSVFLENRGNRPLVAYVVQWRFTRADGTNEYFRKAVMNPEALIQGKTQGDVGQSDRIEVNSSRLLTLLSPEGAGMLRTTLTPSEAEAVKNGSLKFDRAMLLERFKKQAADYTDVTVSIDAAFFDDGTFVGPDTTNFFSQTKAAIDAKYNLLEEIADDVTTKKRAHGEIYKHLEQTVGQAPENLDAKSTEADYYNHFKAMYANEVLSMKTIYGEDKALDFAVLPLHRGWPKLIKKQD